MSRCSEFQFYWGGLRRGGLGEFCCDSRQMYGRFTRDEKPDWNEENKQGEQGNAVWDKPEQHKVEQLDCEIITHSN